MVRTTLRQNTSTSSSSSSIPYTTTNPYSPTLSSKKLNRSSYIKGFLVRKISTKTKPSESTLFHQLEIEKQRQKEASRRQKPPAIPLIYNSEPVVTTVSLPPADDFAVTSNGINTLINNRAKNVSRFPSRKASSLSSKPLSPSTLNKGINFSTKFSNRNSVMRQITTNPQRVRKCKGYTPFNILILGERSSGKTLFLNFLKSSLSPPTMKRAPRPSDLREDIFAPPYTRVGMFEKHYLETKIEGERVGLTFWDSEGLETSVLDHQLQEILEFIDSKFEETFIEESKLVRTPGGINDSNIHVIFLLLDPIQLDRTIVTDKASTIQESWLNGTFKFSSDGFLGNFEENLNIKIFRSLQGRCTIIPVISKADTVTTSHMAFLKRNVQGFLRRAEIDPLYLLRLGNIDDESCENSGQISQKPGSEFDNHGNGISSLCHKNSRSNSRTESLDESILFPLSIISPDISDSRIIGRQFPWGLADSMNEEHCDFVGLRDAIFADYRQELRQVCRTICYENWRTRRLYNFHSQ